MFAISSVIAKNVYYALCYLNKTTSSFKNNCKYELFIFNVFNRLPYAVIKTKKQWPTDQDNVGIQVGS